MSVFKGIYTCCDPHTLHINHRMFIDSADRANVLRIHKDINECLWTPC